MRDAKPEAIAATRHRLGDDGIDSRGGAGVFDVGRLAEACATLVVSVVVPGLQNDEILVVDALPRRT